MADKQIKISFVLQETNAIERAKKLIDELTGSINALTQASAKAGAGPSVTTDSIPSGVAGGRRQSTPAPSRGSKDTRRGKGLAESIFGPRGEMTQIATEFKSGLTSASQSLTTFVTNAENSVRKLSSVVNGLLEQFEALNKASAAMAGGKQGSPVIAAALPSVAPGAGGATPGAGAATPAAVANAANALKTITGSTAGGTLGPITTNVLGGIQNLASGNMMGFLGSVLGRTTMVGAALYAGLRVGETINNALADERLTRIDYTVDEPFARYSRRAAMAAPFQNLGRAALYKDINHFLATQAVLGNKELMETFRDENVQLRKERAELRAMSGGRVEGALKDAIDWLRKPSQHPYEGKWVKETARGMRLAQPNEPGAKIFRAKPSGDIVDTLATLGGDQKSLGHLPTARTIERERAYANIAPEMAAQLSQAIQHEKELQPVLRAEARHRLATGAMGRVQIMRAAGLRMGDIKLPDGTVIDRYTHWKAGLMERGLEEGDYLAGHHQLLNIGLGYRRARGVSPEGLRLVEIAGLGNAAQLVAAGGMISSSVRGAGDFLAAAQSTIGGRRGLDVAVGRELWGAVGQEAIRRGITGDLGRQYGLMMAEMIGGAEWGDVGAQHRRARMLQLGFGRMEDYTSGRAAPLHDALSFMSALSATGGVYGRHTEVLRELPPWALRTMAEGGEVPPEIAGLFPGGASEAREAARKFLRHSSFQLITEAIPGLVLGESGELLRQAREAIFSGKANDLGDFIQQRSAKLTGRKKAEQEERDARMLAATLKLGDEQSGAILSLLGRKTAKGPGARAVKLEGSDAKVLRRDAEAERAIGRAMASEGVKKDIESYTADPLKPFEQAEIGRQIATGLHVTDMKDAAEHTAIAFQNAAQALLNLVSSMKQNPVRLK